MSGIGRVDNGAGGPIPVNSRLVAGGLVAGRFDTMPALFREKEPFDFSIYQLFLHADKLVSIKGDVCRVLVASLVDSCFRREIMPLLTRNLASPTGCTTGCIDKK
jgi:hypothetical protein